MKKVLLLLFLLNICACYPSHVYKESYYQNQWCNKWHGVTEYRLDDETRVDCLTQNYAVEFDFAQKWAESIGQSLYYSLETGKKPAIVLIIEDEYDFIYYERAKKLTDKYNIQLWYMEKPEKQYGIYDEQSIENLLYSYIYAFFRRTLNKILDSIFG